MTLHICRECGNLWPARPPATQDGGHRGPLGDACRGHAEPASLAQLVTPSLTALWAAQAREQRAIQLAEKLASRLTVAQVTIRKLSSASGRNLQRYIVQLHHARALEAQLAAAGSTSGSTRAVRELARAEELLIHLSTSPCASCGLTGDHRYNCRIRAALARIALILHPS